MCSDTENYGAGRRWWMSLLGTRLIEEMDKIWIYSCVRFLCGSRCRFVMVGGMRDSLGSVGVCGVTAMVGVATTGDEA